MVPRRARFDCFRAGRYSAGAVENGRVNAGEVTERLNVLVSKTSRPARVSGVRIPPSPFFLIFAVPSIGLFRVSRGGRVCSLLRSRALFPIFVILLAASGLTASSGDPQL